ncbi:nodulation protein NfeD [Candidatus Bathyarchaeota archaeon]|nr:nodulation protein NfeD [Candidatus Bathyarchaeota archaeon]
MEVSGRAHSIAGLLWLMAVLLLTPSLVPISAEQRSDTVLLVQVRGEITEATRVMVEDSLAMAEAVSARLVVFEEDTPGGEAGAVREIMKLLENSATPTCVFVYPSGGAAWSGGTYILMASHIAAMAPGTTIGSCQPVLPTGEVVESSKYVNAYADLIANHARLHGRNETAARLFVTENLNLGPEEALAQGVIEVTAEDLTDLLKRLEDLSLLKVEGPGGVEQWRVVSKDEAQSYDYITRVDFEGIGSAQVIDYTPGLQVFFLGVLFNPLVSSLLLVIGLFTLLIGIKTPGWGAEIAGAICLILSLVSLGAIGVTPAAVLFFVLGVTLIIAELKTHIGILAVSGAACLVIASLFLFPSPQWLLRREVARRIQEVLVSVSVVIAAVFGFLVYKIAETRGLKPRTGARALIGARGVAVSDLDPLGEVRVLGEYWRARTEGRPVRRGEKIIVVGREGLILVVRGAEEKV